MELPNQSDMGGLMDPSSCHLPMRHQKLRKRWRGRPKEIAQALPSYLGWFDLLGWFPPADGSHARETMKERSKAPGGRGIRYD